MKSLRARINRLALRRAGRFWIEPLGEDDDGVPMEAQVVEHPNGEQWALVVPVPIDDPDEWAREWQRIEAKRRERLSMQPDRVSGAIGSERA